ncbi:MAG: DUF1553 domain-containing protein [Verrucomicrobia bacterium]|nr:DUF1553 domain-containing protein [Verrucomicrobiota bacterium]
MKHPLVILLAALAAAGALAELPLPAESIKEETVPTEHGRGSSAGGRSGLNHWAFQPIRRPALPKLASNYSAASPIDLFILAKLAAYKLEPAPRATRRELIRRAYFDLIGLPPSPEAIDDFVRDNSPNAFEERIDSLLAQPQYGERWARHWLDVVRYGQSNGYERDDEKPLAWRYRDYVIKAFNEDKPFARFILEQLAGDELKDPTFDSITATGFYRLGVWDDEPDDKRMAVFDELDDIVSTAGTAFLGLSLGCARCHDHKFDPISQKDYYQLLSFIRNIRPYQNSDFALDAANYTPLAPAEKVNQWRARQEARLKPFDDERSALQKSAEKTKAEIGQVQAKIKQLNERLASILAGPEKEQLQSQIGGFTNQIKAFEAEAKKTEEAKRKVEEQINRIRKEPAPFEWALSVRENPETTPTHLLVRGSASTPGAEVRPAFLAVLGGERPTRKRGSSEAESTGLRSALADWVANRDNPLTARVMVNRIWQHLFGRGLVKTTGDFGHSGTAPTHPELLDWLAASFMDAGWSVKSMLKQIMLSQTYQMSSRVGGPSAAADPGNEWFWRQNLRRLEAEAVRDAMLSISGRLNLKMGGRGFFPHLAGEVIAGASNPGLDWEISSDEERSRRTIYTFIKRTMLFPVLENFDYSNTASSLGERPVTTVAPQALMLLNDRFFQKQAAAFAQRLTREVGEEPGKQIQRAYRLAVGREPSARELEIAADYLKRQTAAFAGIRSRLTFRPDISESLNEGYMNRLPPVDMMIGPRASWSYHRGVWGGGYSGIKTLERTRGPFALWAGETVADGIIQARVTLHKASELAGLVFRGQVTNEALHGYDVIVDHRFQRLTLQRHTTNAATLAEVKVPIRVEEACALKIESIGPRIRVWLNGGTGAIIDAIDPKPLLQPGRVGVRACGAAVSIDDLRMQIGDRTIDCATSSRDAPAALGAVEGGLGPSRRALESFCLLLLNLNEVIYVD